MLLWKGAYENENFWPEKNNKNFTKKQIDNNIFSITKNKILSAIRINTATLNDEYGENRNEL